MSSSHIGRRSLLGGLVASAFAPIAGLLAGKAKANELDLKTIGEVAGTLKPIPMCHVPPQPAYDRIGSTTP